MALKVEHELHRRRRGRNVGLALLLAGFVVLVLALTVVKVQRVGFAPLQGYDHVVQPTLVPAAEGGRSLDPVTQGRGN
ncbi:hypothetical protein SAMN05216257_103178 [Meinhardsimonia xiamenensis]|jgi:hypothetical protein|uniref:Cytochrome C oxidase assembly protein n=1 Tax=Meinhardsimonia xiamenensis TaxID=990712 RepID=A0A1G9CPH9_9RHOB|nr:hypothetical protein [Meinhardsimonia xiamenensis]PRX38295.1 hypothetical protein LV81_00576 [Meinhardsimonia xiamenensis]SDK53345.1 hypothetical protein SAMN05216257_103178 [Meinhardsimonia xiamenensis]